MENARTLSLKQRARYSFGGITQQELAYEYGVGQTLIGNAINKRRYCYEK